MRYGADSERDTFAPGKLSTKHSSEKKNAVLLETQTRPVERWRALL
jgi:hypothetical protein